MIHIYVGLYLFSLHFLCWNSCSPHWDQISQSCLCLIKRWAILVYMLLYRIVHPNSYCSFSKTISKLSGTEFVKICEVSWWKSSANQYSQPPTASWIESDFQFCSISCISHHSCLSMVSTIFDPVLWRGGL